VIGVTEAGVSLEAKLPKGIRLRRGKFMVDLMVDGVRRTATYPTLEEAREKRAELYEELSSSSSLARTKKRDTDSRPWTFSEAWEFTLNNVWSGTPQENESWHHFRQLMALVGHDTPVTAIDTPKIDNVVEHLLATGNASGTINKKLSYVSTVLKQASMRPGQSGLRYVPHIPGRKVTNRRVRYLTPDEELRHIERAMVKGWYTYIDQFILLIDTGMRLNECWKLTGKDCHLSGSDPWINVWRGKTHNSTAVPLTERALAILRKRSVEPSQRVFSEMPEGQAANWRFEEKFRKIRVELGLGEDKQYVPHVLRHTFASRLAQAGVDILMIQKLMGHSSIIQTMRYAHLNTTSLSVAIKALDNFNNRGPS